MDKLLKLKELLETEIKNIKDDVDEAFDWNEGMNSGEYNCGHAQDSFDRGWDCGEVVGESDGLNKALKMLNELIGE